MADNKSNVIEADPFEDPATGDFIDWDECVDQGLLFKVTEYDPHIPTKNTKPGEKSPCVITDVIVLTGENAGNVYDDVKVWSKTMVPQLKPKVGKMIVATLTKVPKPEKGKNSFAWVLEPGTDEHKNLARTWLANNKPKDPFSDPVSDADQ
jgi:hypothetical protein